MSVQSFSYGPYVATAKAVPSGSGYTSEWWVSAFWQEANTLSVVRFMDIPVYGDSRELANQRISFVQDQVIQFIAGHADGMAPPTQVPKTLDHVHEHLRLHAGHVESIHDDLAETAAVYSLLADFKVRNPSDIIANYLHVNSVRTVHDRVRRAREAGLIERHGRGKSHS